MLFVFLALIFCAASRVVYCDMLDRICMYWFHESSRNNIAPHLFCALLSSAGWRWQQLRAWHFVRYPGNLGKLQSYACVAIEQQLTGHWGNCSICRQDHRQRQGETPLDIKHGQERLHLLSLHLAWQSNHCFVTVAELRSFLASAQVTVQLQAEFPSEHFVWGCGVLEDKSLCVDQVSALPLVCFVPWFVEHVPNQKDKRWFAPVAPASRYHTTMDALSEKHEKCGAAVEKKIQGLVKPLDLTALTEERL